MGLALIFNHHQMHQDQKITYVCDGDARGRLPAAHASEPGEERVEGAVET